MGNAAGSTSAADSPIGARVVIKGATYRIEEQLGEGGFAFVFKVVDEATSRPYALKKILAGDEDTAASAELEVAIMKNCASKNIVGYKTHITTTRAKRDGRRVPTEYLVLMEYCPGGTLTRFLEKQKGIPISEAQALVIASDICRAVRVLHSQPLPICHRDLKLDNILLGADQTWRLCDFGSATTRVKAYTTKEEITLEEEHIQQYTTPSYRAPEMANLWQRRVVGPKADIWALGCILYFLAFLRHPFQGSTNSTRITFPNTLNGFSQGYVALVRDMLNQDPSSRPDIVTVTSSLSSLQRGERPPSSSSFMQPPLPSSSPPTRSSSSSSFARDAPRTSSKRQSSKSRSATTSTDLKGATTTTSTDLKGATTTTTIDDDLQETTTSDILNLFDAAVETTSKETTTRPTSWVQF